jgi:hypothetical protein
MNNNVNKKIVIPRTKYNDRKFSHHHFSEFRVKFTKENLCFKSMARERKFPTVIQNDTTT